MNKRIYQVLKIVIVSIIIISLILSVIVSLDYHHLETCEEEHCFVCSVIHIAQNIVSLILVAYVWICTSFFIHFCLARMRTKCAIFVKASLIFQKVQLNE